MYEVIIIGAKLAMLAVVGTAAMALAGWLFKSLAVWTLTALMGQTLRKETLINGSAVGVAVGLAAAAVLPTVAAGWQVFGLAALGGATVAFMQLFRAVYKLHSQDIERYMLLSAFAENRIERGIYSAKLYD